MLATKCFMPIGSSIYECSEGHLVHCYFIIDGRNRVWALGFGGNTKISDGVSTRNAMAEGAFASSYRACYGTHIWQHTFPPSIS